jgi:hypothetical protein
MSRVEIDSLVEKLRGEVYALRRGEEHARDKCEELTDALALAEARTAEARAIVDLAYAMFLAADLPNLADTLDKRRVWLKE